MPGGDQGANGETPKTWEDPAGGPPLPRDPLQLDDEQLDHEGAHEEADRLRFNEEERLPWLEADDDDDDYEGADGARILGFVIAGLVVLAALVGGVWWLTHRTTDDTLVADGSTIEAPAAPYKEAPKNPGGKTFDGTGDSAFVVSAGKTPPARLGQSGAPAPAPAPAPAAAPSAAATPAATASASPAPVAGPGVQIGAYSSQAAADAAWQRLSGQYEALSGVRHRVTEGKADIGTVYRLQAVPGDIAAANGLCARLKAAGLPCQVKQ